jgi:hypothetical protein
MIHPLVLGTGLVDSTTTPKGVVIAVYEAVRP